MKILKFIPCMLLLLTGCSGQKSKEQDTPVAPIDNAITLKLSNYNKYLNVEHTAVDMGNMIHMVLVTPKKEGIYDHVVLTLNCGGFDVDVEVDKEGKANHTYISNDMTFSVVGITGTYKREINIFK